MDEAATPMAKFIIEIIILSTTGIIATMTVLLRKKISELFISCIEKIFKLKIYSSGGHYDKSAVEKDKIINSVLTELRISTRADRVQVFQFHNGNMFTSKNQMWKLSCTHEIVDTVKSSQGELQNILSSSVSDLLHPLWASNDLNDYLGVERISPNHCNCLNKENCKFPNGVYFYDIDKIKEGFAKGLLASHSVHFMIKSPLVDTQENLIGFICLDYCWDECSAIEIKACAELLCKTATRIAYELTR